jgi:hypothetical protein
MHIIESVRPEAGLISAVDLGSKVVTSAPKLRIAMNLLFLNISPIFSLHIMVICQERKKKSRAGEKIFLWSVFYGQIFLRVEDSLVLGS